MAGADYALEHFYYGQFVRDGKPDGELRLLAMSAGMRQEQVNELVRAALVPPIPAAPMASWAVARGKSVPFVFCQSQMGEVGGAMLHFVLLPVELLRALSGNLTALSRLLMLRMPAYDRMGDTLPAIKFADVAPPSNETQVDAMLTLMTATRDRLDVVEALLASIVQGVPLIVRGAPVNPAARVTFIEGLLALLPPPARFGVTFAMHTLPVTRVDAQIRFIATADVPDDATIFHWPGGALSGKIVADDYSRFIVSQLRLDTSIVLEQTNALTAVASWRIRRGDGLSDALRYASKRLSLDDSVVNGQAVDAREAARILAEDPTLTDSLRAAYARHVLAFALVLGDMQHAEPIAIMLRQQPELETATMEQMRDALQNGKAEVVYEALSGWLANPLGPRGMEWIALMQDAALARTRTLVDAGDAPGVRDFLRRLHDSSDGQDEMGSVLPDMIETALPLMQRDPELADTLFVLGAQHFSPERFARMVTNQALVAHLPEAVSRVAVYLQGIESTPVPHGLLMRAASGFGEAWEALVLVRLAEVALQVGRLDLLDAPTLGSLARAAETLVSTDYDPVFLLVVVRLSSDDLLPTLDVGVPRSLLQILLARRAYVELARELVRQSRVLYSADKQPEYGLMVRRLFVETPIKIDETAESLRLLEEGGVKPLPLAMAHLGALKRNDWQESLQPVADRVTEILFEHRDVLEAIPPAPLVELLQFHVQHRDVNNSIRIADLLPLVAANRGDAGAALMVQMFRALDWDRQARNAALEVLRRYIRVVDGAYVEQAIARMGEALGERVLQVLSATYVFRAMLAGSEDMASYALHLHLTTRFLRDTALVYTDKTQPPGIRSLFGDLDSLVGGLNDDERHAIARAMLSVGRSVVALGKQQHDNRPRDMDTHAAALLTGDAAPSSALDALRVMGGYFARGRRLRLNMERSTGAHPLGDRAAPSLLRESQVVARTLRGLVRAFPPEKKVTLAPETIRSEAESLWSDLSLAERRKLVQALATDLQSIPELVTMIYESGDARALDEKSGLGRKLDANRRRPETALEFYRFVHGYFSLRTGNQGT